MLVNLRNKFDGSPNFLARTYMIFVLTMGSVNSPISVDSSSVTSSNPGTQKVLHSWERLK